MTHHPSKALFEGSVALPAISSCDHYAGNLKLAEKALSLQSELTGSFDITLDLEDGAARGNEAELLEGFLQIIRSPANTFHKVGIRVLDFHSPLWKTQVEQIAERVADSISHITIPKTRTSEELALMIEFLQRRCERIGFRGRIPVHVLIETPTAVQEINEIAALPWLRSLDFGLMDFVSSHCGAIPSSAMKSPGQFDHALVRRAKTEIVAAATANDLIATHNVTIAYSDVEQTRQDARRARNEFGFLRMWSIHPAQIRPILEAMSPQLDEIQLAARILVEAHTKSWAPLSLDGTLYDRASYRYYWGILQRARVNGLPIDNEAQRLFFPS